VAAIFLPMKPADGLVTLPLPVQQTACPGTAETVRSPVTMKQPNLLNCQLKVRDIQNLRLRLERQRHARYRHLSRRARLERVTI